MKSKKKVGLVKRIAAGVCAVVLAVGCMGSVSYYATEHDNIQDISVLLSNKGYMCPDLLSGYDYVVFKCSNTLYIIGLPTGVGRFAVRHGLSANICLYTSVYPSKFSDFGVLWFQYHSSSGWTDKSSDYASLTGYDTPVVTDISAVWYSDRDLYYECACGGVDTCLYWDEGFAGSLAYDSPYYTEKPQDSYNSSLGYLQNVQKKNLTLDGENYDPDYDSWQVMFTFDSTSTTGLDITTGGYSVRHFMNWEVRDKDSNVVRSYDKVSCGEYDASSCKISYPLYSTRQAAMEESGFEALSWWESGVLGYEVYIYDYLQLVRTNEDGSVEYGGYVRINENGYVADTLDDNFTEDPDGYLDQDVPSSSGSGSNYEDAEHDADKNASNSSDSGTDLLSQINILISLVKAVPELIMEIFSFLPNWCLDLVGAAFTFSIMITIYKLAN